MYGMDDMKNRIVSEVENIKESLIKASDEIHANPELGYEEYKAVEILTSELKKHGFELEIGILGIPTAFRATFKGKEEGLTIALMAEYDALPEIGHACGHNLIGTMAIGAAIALSKLMSNLPGKIVVLGSPAEETSGAKVTMVEKGIFDEVDVAMMVHPEDGHYTYRSSSAIDALEFVYKGKVAQYSITPWDGINALDGVLQLFSNINALRLRLKPEIRVSGIIVKGGVAANVMPDEAIARFYVRAPERKKLDEAVDAVVKCAEGAAIATQTSLSINNYEFSFKNMVPNLLMAQTYANNLRNLGVADEDIDEEYMVAYGSQDMGDVSYVVPAIHPYITIAPKGTKTHSIELAEAAASPQGHAGLLLGAKAMALTSYDILTNPELFKRIKEEFDKTFNAEQ